MNAVSSNYWQPAVEIPAGRIEESFPDHKPLYTPGEARAEANRCLFCYDAPCIKACPTGIDIPKFIKKIATDNVLGSARTILEANLLGYSCGCVCPVEVLCVGACVYNDWKQPPIQIGRLQRYATETVFSAGLPVLKPRNLRDGRVALVGAGPASLSCAGTLALEGVDVVIFEWRQLPGGLNTTGVAPYKMYAPDSLKEVAFIQSLGVRIKTGVEVGRDISAEELLREYDAVFLGVGLGPDSRLDLPGEDGPGVYGATALIERLKNDATFRLPATARVLVVGGGNTAIDAARELAQLTKADVAMVYRRRQADMPGYAHELKQARQEGARFIENTVPLAVLRKGKRVRALRVAKAEKGKALPGTEQELAADLIVVAIGQARLTALASLFPGVRVDRRGRIAVDPATGRTGNPRVYAGGDCANGGKEVVNAVEEGKIAARAILKTLDLATRNIRKARHG